MNKKEQFIHINEYGTKCHYSDRNMEILHREDGPAIEYADGDKEWWINGKLHREDGPAIEDADGYKAWWINGKQLTEEEFDARRNPTTELTLHEIAEKFGIREVKSVTIKFQTSMTF